MVAEKTLSMGAGCDKLFESSPCNLESAPVLKSCVEKLKVFSQNSALTLQSVEDCFGQPLSPDDDEVLSSLQSAIDEQSVDLFHRTVDVYFMDVSVF